MAKKKNEAKYSDKDLKQFKQTIEKKLKRAREDVAELKETLANSSENPDNESGWNYEDSTDHAEKEQLINLISRQVKFIKNLEDALLRVESKTYGICRVTGKLIDKRRLLAVPHTTISVEAKLQEQNTQAG